jgi:uncharacterized glyoxalase superfamily protein PhnB
MTATAPAPNVWPTLNAHDARGLIRFLVDAFGFEEVVVYGEGDRVDHAELSWPLGGGVMLGSAGGSDDGFPLHLPGSFGAYVVTDDADALYERAKAAGAEVVREPNDTDTARATSASATRRATDGRSAPTAGIRARAERRGHAEPSTVEA